MQLDKSIAKSIAGLGCIALAFWGFEHDYSGSILLVFLGAVILLDMVGEE